jgi:hypothetical protein
MLLVSSRLGLSDLHFCGIYVAGKIEIRRAQCPNGNCLPETSMKIFRDVPLDQKAETIDGAIDAIRHRKRERRLDARRWSLAELFADDDDYAWLRRWSAQLDESTVQIHLRYSQKQENLGLLLLLLAAESCRREAPEDQFWPILLGMDWRPETRARLFSEKHPRQSHKEAIETACHSWNLRHVFDSEGVQQWFQTIPLQFGFTRLGFDTRLADWLTGAKPPSSVQRLLLPGDPNYSESFELLWSSLKLLRQGRITLDRIDHVLIDSCWVLPSWHQQIKCEAFSRIETLGYGNSDLPVHATITLQSNNDDTASFVGEPRLLWRPPGAPVFRLDVVGIAEMGLTSDCYSIEVGGKERGLLVKQPDGTFRGPQEGFVTVEFPTGPETQACLRDAEGHVIRAQSIQFWTPDAEVVGFNAATGRQFDPWSTPINTAQPCILMIASELQLVPNGPHVRRNSKVACIFLSSNWPSETRVMFNSETVWQPVVNSSNSFGRLSSELSSQVTIGVSGTRRFGSRLSLTISHPRDVQVRFVRVAGQSADFCQKSPSQTVAGPIVFNSSVPGSRVKVMIGFHGANGSICIRRDENLRMEGVEYLSKNGWEVLKASETLERSTAEDCLFRLFPPDESYHDRLAAIDWAIIEGSVFLKFNETRPSRISGLAALGAPLALRRGPYNRPPGERDFPIASSVVDHGVIDPDGVQLTEQTVILKLTRPIEPDRRHVPLVIGTGGELRVIQSSELQVESNLPDLWKVDLTKLPSWFVEMTALAIGYDGQWIGAWWAPGWYRQLFMGASSLSRTQAFELATLLRWCRLPVVSLEAMRSVQGFAVNAPVEALRAWLFEDSATISAPVLRFGDAIGMDLKHREIEESWTSAIANLLAHWMPTPEQAREIFVLAEQNLMDHPEKERFHLSLQHITTRFRRMPFLLSRIVDAYVMGREKRETMVFLSWLKELMRVPSPRVDSDPVGWAPEFRKSIIDCARRIYHGSRLDDWELNNLQLGLNLEPICRQVAVQLFEDAMKGDSADVAIGRDHTRQRDQAPTR